MAVYKANGSDLSTIPLKLTEHYIYGSSRLGVINRNMDVDQPRLTPDNSNANLGTAYLATFTRGDKLFEFTNHLGNVLFTATDGKVPKAQTGNPSLVGSYSVNMVTAVDYTPFGMIMQGMNYGSAAPGKYRYGFNGKEWENSTKGNADQIDYGERMYDNRAGRFLSVDPKYRNFPWYTPYQYAGNKPIVNLDLDGLEELSYLVVWSKGQTQIKLQHKKEYTDGWFGWKWTQKPISERYEFQIGAYKYYIGFTGETKGAGNNSPEQLALARYYAENAERFNLGYTFLKEFFYEEGDSYKIWRGEIKNGSHKANISNIFLALAESGIEGLMDVVTARGINYKGFSKGQLKTHYEKHVVEKKEFGEITQSEYLNKAKEFAKEESESISEAVVGNFFVKYDATTRKTLISHLGDREIRTFYIADKEVKEPFVEAVKLAMDLSKH
jgi:RHS repeat-associated protein